MSLASARPNLSVPEQVTYWSDQIFTVSGSSGVITFDQLDTNCLNTMTSLTVTSNDTFTNSDPFPIVVAVTLYLRIATNATTPATAYAFVSSDQTVSASANFNFPIPTTLNAYTASFTLSWLMTLQPAEPFSIELFTTGASGLTLGSNGGYGSGGNSISIIRLA